MKLRNKKMELKFEKEYIQKEAEQRYTPSEEFLDGEKPLEYNFKFSTGEKFIAVQSNRGGGIIVIERSGKKIFDFADILPEGYKFVTPTYFKKHPNERHLLDYTDNDWRESSKRKLIFLGEFKSPQDILILLHEIGHATSSGAEEDAKIRERLEDDYYESLSSKDAVSKVLVSEEKAKIISKSERQAWAWALKSIRKIQKETGVDFKSLFSSFSDIKQYIDSALATHRRSFEWIIKDSYDEDFYKELQTYFDRWQYDTK